MLGWPLPAERSMGAGVSLLQEELLLEFVHRAALLVTEHGYRAFEEL